MKICDVVQFHSPVSGGVKRYIEDKSRHIQRLGRPWSHLVVTPAARDVRRVDGNVTHLGLASPRLPGSASYRLLVSGRRIRDIIRAEQPDLIEVGDPYLAAWQAVQAGRAEGIPVVAFYHSDYPRAFGRTLGQVAGRQVGACFDSLAAGYLRALYGRVQATFVATRRYELLLAQLGIPGLIRVPLGVDVDRFRPQPDRAAVRAGLGLPAGFRLLLYVGRLAAEKNVLSLVGLMDHLAADPGGCRLVVVGHGEQRGRLAAACAGRADIRLLDYCASAEALAGLYSAADLLVHAGTAETFGLVSIEAQACGTPVVSVRDGGLDETIPAADAALRAASAAPADLAVAVRAALGRTEGPEQRGDRAARIRSAFPAARVFERLLDNYVLIRDRHAAGPVEDDLDVVTAPFPTQAGP